MSMKQAWRFIQKSLRKSKAQVIGSRNQGLPSYTYFLSCGEWGNILYRIDPLGRETHYEYASNGIDLLLVRQKNGNHRDTLAQITWDERHRPVAMTDAAGQTTRYTYNEAGQLARRTGPLGGTERYDYDDQGRLHRIIDALGHAELFHKEVEKFHAWALSYPPEERFGEWECDYEGWIGRGCGRPFLA
jgi:YD repeat-containing protein